jgi:hypothetical protein
MSTNHTNHTNKGPVLLLPAKEARPAQGRSILRGSVPGGLSPFVWFVWFVDKISGRAAYSPSSRSRASSGSMIGAPSRMG